MIGEQEGGERESYSRWLLAVPPLARTYAWINSPSPPLSTKSPATSSSPIPPPSAPARSRRPHAPWRVSKAPSTPHVSPACPASVRGRPRSSRSCYVQGHPPISRSCV